MIDAEHALPITRQAQLLKLSRASVYYLPRATPTADLTLMRRIDELHLNHPFAGSRMLRDSAGSGGLLRRAQARGDAHEDDGHRGAVSTS